MTAQNSFSSIITNEPPLIPEIPPGMLDAANKGKLVVFVGAGVSNIVGSPTWDEFANRLINDMRKRGFINYIAEKSLKSIDAKKKITICKGIYKANGTAIPFKELLEPDHGLGTDVYKRLYSFGAIFLTTNWDKYLDDQAGPSNVVYREEDMLVSRLSPGIILHIHGSIQDCDAIIVGARDYLKLYQQGKKVPELLREVFEGMTVLFIGYGLEEYEILEYLISRADPVNDGIRHYMLFPACASETVLNEHLREYYRDLGIGLIPYSTSENGPEQLVNVIKDWAPQINAAIKPPSFYNGVDLIDKEVT